MSTPPGLERKQHTASIKMDHGSQPRPTAHGGTTDQRALEDVFDDVPRGEGSNPDRSPGDHRVHSERVLRTSSVRELSPRPSVREFPEPNVAPKETRPAAAPTSAGTPAVSRPHLGVVASNYFNKTLVGAYKLVGFALLSLILVGLFAYIALNGLFFLHHQWAAPAVIAPSDLRVIELRARLAHELWNRQKVDAERTQLSSNLRHAERVVEMEEQYQATFQTAVSKNAHLQYKKLRDFREVQREVSLARGKLEKAADDFTRERTASTETARAAHLIDNQAKATEDFRMAELDAKRVQLQQEAVELDARLAQLGHDAKALTSVVKAPQDSTPATFEALQLKRSYLNSLLERDRARDQIAALTSAQRALDEALKGYDSVISIIQESPLLLAAEGELTIAFAPYENLSEIAEGDPVYGCWARVIGCRVIGKVGGTIEGEVTAKHPVYGTDLRGKFVRLELFERAWAEEVVLHIKRPPLFF